MPWGNPIRCVCVMVFPSLGYKYVRLKEFEHQFLRDKCIIQKCLLLYEPYRNDRAFICDHQSDSMIRLKMSVVGVVSWMLLLQMTSAYSVIGLVPRNHRIIRSTEETCDREVVNSLAKSTNETCFQISIVDTYIENVRSRESLPVPTATDRHGFKEILSQYNGDLKTAQQHCEAWRNNENVVGSLKDVVVAANGFEPKFNQELQEINANIKHILEKHEDVAKVESKILAIKKDIEAAQENLQLTNVSAVVSHLETTIKNKEEEINNIMKEHDVAQIRREVNELVKYLGFVKKDAGNVEEKAEAARTKINNFKDNVVTDAEAFKRDRSNAEKGILKIQEEETNNNNDLQSNRANINNLRFSITQGQSQIATLNTQIANSRREVADIEARINRMMRKTRKKKRFGRWFRFVPVAGWVIGGKFYKDAKRREEQLANEKRHFINQGAQQIRNLQANIASNQRNIASHESRIGQLEAKSLELEKELEYYTQLDGKLQDVQNEVNVILPFIANAASAVSKMKDTFDVIQQNLADIIQRANESQSEAELNNMKFFIYNEIDQLKCKWNKASEKIVPVAECKEKVVIVPEEVTEAIEITETTESIENALLPSENSTETNEFVTDTPENVYENVSETSE